MYRDTHIYIEDGSAGEMYSSCSVCLSVLWLCVSDLTHRLLIRRGKGGEGWSQLLHVYLGEGGVIGRMGGCVGGTLSVCVSNE